VQADLILFWVFAPISVASAIGMLVMRNAVHSALFLIVNFFCLALFYLVLGATFLFAVQIIVYAGAIMVLFLFVIMLLGVDGRVADARIVCFGVGPRPARVRDAERALVGGSPSPSAFAEAGRLTSAAVDPDDDIHASRGYRKRLAGVLAARALAAAALEAAA